MKKKHLTLYLMTSVLLISGCSKFDSGKATSVKVKAKISFFLQRCVSACLGSKPKRVISLQDAENQMIGKYETREYSKWAKAHYKDLDIRSNNVYSCSCLVPKEKEDYDNCMIGKCSCFVSGEWVSVTGKWKLIQHNRTAEKWVGEGLHEFNTTYCIVFSDMLFNAGMKGYMFLPFKFYDDKGGVSIICDDDAGIYFEKKQPIEK